MGYFLFFGLPVLVGAIGTFVLLFVILYSLGKTGKALGLKPRQLKRRKNRLLLSLVAVCIPILLNVFAFGLGPDVALGVFHPSWHNELTDLWILAGVNIGGFVTSLVLLRYARS